MSKAKKSKKSKPEQPVVTAVETNQEKPKKYERKVDAELGAALASYLMFRFVDFKVEWGQDNRFRFRVHKKDMDVLDQQADLMEQSIN